LPDEFSFHKLYRTSVFLRLSVFNISNINNIRKILKKSFFVTNKLKTKKFGKIINTKMETKTKFIIGILAIALLIVVAVEISILSTTTGNVIAGEKPTIRIGISLPLTGGQSNLGQGAQKAALMALDDLKNTKYNYQLIIEDDQMDAKQATTAVQKLISVDNINAIISFTSGPGNAISPIAEENKITHIGIASDSNVAKGEYNFIHWTTPQEQVRVLIEEFQRRNITKIAIMAVNQQGVLATVQELKSKLPRTEIEITGLEMYNFGDKDFRTQLLKAKETNPQIYLLLCFSPELETIVKQAKEMGIEQFTAIESFEYTDQMDLFEGLWYVQAADASQKYNQEFISKYKTNPTLASGNVYDAFNLLVASFEKAGDGKKAPQSNSVALALSGIKNYDGVLGILNVMPNHIINSKAVVREIQNSKPVTIRS
jgi:branched-chain amino acid transport system substrate-binding protein